MTPGTVIVDPTAPPIDATALGAIGVETDAHRRAPDPLRVEHE